MNVYFTKNATFCIFFIYFVFFSFFVKKKNRIVLTNFTKICDYLFLSIFKIPNKILISKVNILATT